MSTKEDYEEDIKKLFESWKNKSPSGRINHRHNGFIEDGIVNTEEWFSNNKGKENENRKILLVLKEAYGLDTSLIDFIRNQSYESAPKIWKRISQIVDGILETTVEKIKPFSENITYNYNEIINNIAVINLKKSDGKSTSDCDEILEYARYDENEIKKQINMIKPNIIIFGSTFWIVNEIYHDKLRPNKKSNDNWFYYTNNILDNESEVLLIDYYHPGNHFPDLLNYYGLMNIYQQALLAKK